MKDISTAFHVASRELKLEVVNYLVTCGIDWPTKVHDISTALHDASEEGHLEIVKLLATAFETDMKAESQGLSNALFAACSQGHLEIVKFLVACEGLDTSNLDSRGNKALYLASCGGNLEIVKILTDFELIEPLLYHDISVGLCNASKYGHFEVVKFFATCEGVDFSFKDRSGMTALHWASYRGDLKTIKLLVSCGADISIKCLADKTALHYIASRGKWIEVVKYLITSGIELDATERRGQTALHHAVINNNLRITKLLIARGSDLMIRDQNMKTPLDLAQESNVEFISSHCSTTQLGISLSCHK
eukprot:TRINITY_DN1378_c0_g1_i2.p1 TRINITY_DN1378_c0_g1~~TRINITY_DN1378_c0_g1_i2.p1  ORF type:complete len:305 (-),score=36.28 TRINITY_DN1378_c0_g1_i2:30-944(-)